MTLAVSSAKRHTQRYGGVLLCDGLRFRSLVLAEEKHCIDAGYCFSSPQAYDYYKPTHQRTDD